MRRNACKHKMSEMGEHCEEIQRNMLRTKRSFGSLKRGMKKLKKALVYQEMITDFSPIDAF